jgi:hypothetical protein
MSATVRQIPVIPRVDSLASIEILAHACDAYWVKTVDGIYRYRHIPSDVRLPPIGQRDVGFWAEMVAAGYVAGDREALRNGRTHQIEKWDGQIWDIRKFPVICNGEVCIVGCGTRLSGGPLSLT